MFFYGDLGLAMAALERLAGRTDIVIVIGHHGRHPAGAFKIIHLDGGLDHIFVGRSLPIAARS